MKCNIKSVSIIPVQRRKNELKLEWWWNLIYFWFTVFISFLWNFTTNFKLMWVLRIHKPPLYQFNHLFFSYFTWRLMFILFLSSSDFLLLYKHRCTCFVVVWRTVKLFNSIQMHVEIYEQLIATLNVMICYAFFCMRLTGNFPCILSFIYCRC